jgi:hypothetical protein
MTFCPLLAPNLPATTSLRSINQAAKPLLHLHFEPTQRGLGGAGGSSLAYTTQNHSPSSTFLTIEKIFVLNGLTKNGSPQ